ncbi:MAG TPA: response regulator [Nitrososphaeraceae archaeon]|nr:response regulator [Nitrososphaeraceae archaeon]
MGSNKKIVSIVDDEIDITELFHDALSNEIASITFVSFNDPLIALEHFIDNKKNYALVIADLRMPGMNGLELLKKIRKFNPKVRTVLMSAYEIDNDPVFRGYVKQGVIDKFIQKPISVRTLYEQVSYQLVSFHTKLRNK